jgi:TIR domain
VIAISYRREDSLPIAGRLYDRLQAKFGKQNVFMDFDSIPAGVDFRERIEQTIKRSELVVAVIGPRWLGEQSDSSRRIDEPTDFVRLEIKYALEQGVPVIPLLVDNTPMPKPEKLPTEIQALAFRNALPLNSGLDFHNHTDRVITGICGLVGASKIAEPEAASIQSATKHPNMELRLGVALAVLIAIAATGSWYFGAFQNAAHMRTLAASNNKPPALSKTSLATETAARSAQSGPLVNARPIYKGMIKTQGEDSASGTPLTISFGDDRKSGTMTQTSKSGDTVVKFDGVWEGTMLRAVTGTVITQPKNIQWKPESFTLRFAEDWKRGSYECNSEGIVYTAELSSP